MTENPGSILWHGGLLVSVFAAMVLAAGCQAVREATHAVDVAPPVPVRAGFPHLAGVDSAVAHTAYRMADSAFVDRPRQEQAAGRVTAGRALLARADSLLRADDRPYLQEPRGPDTTSEEAQAAAIAAFNRGVQELRRYAEAAVADSLQASALLEKAQGHFEQALALNPFDAEARYGLARLFALRARRLGRSGAHEEARQVLIRLARMRPDDHGVFAALATTYEHLNQWRPAATFWQRAARAALDDQALDPDGRVRTDSSLMLSYYVRSERAYVEAGESGAALTALGKAVVWAVTTADSALVAEERAWILWDEGNLATRKRWDALQQLSEADPEAATVGMAALLGRLAGTQARRDVRRRLGLLYYRVGRLEQAADTLRALWRDLAPVTDAPPRAAVDGVGSEQADAVSFAERVRDDYGKVAYNLAVRRHREGDLRAALAYFLQSEQTGFYGAAQAAFKAALLLRNNAREAIRVALRAEARIGLLPGQDQRNLLRYLVELYRRMGDREQALHYVEKYRRLATP